MHTEAATRLKERGACASAHRPFFLCLLCVNPPHACCDKTQSLTHAESPRLHWHVHSCPCYAFAGKPGNERQHHWWELV